MKFEIDEETCILCLACQSACPNQAIELLDTKIKINQNMCDGCGTCAMICPVQAIESITDKIPVQVAKTRVSTDEMERSQSRIQTYQNAPVIKPNIIEELKRIVLDGLKPRTDVAFSRNGTSGCGGGKGRGRQSRKRKKW